MSRARLKTLICRVYETYKHLLMIRSDHPLSPIYSSKNLAKKISRDEERKDKVNLVGEPKKDTAILGRIVVKLEDIGGLYRKLLEEVTELQEDLFGGIGFEDPDWFSFKVPNPLVDEVNNSSAGFCFGDMEMNDLKKYEDVGLRALYALRSVYPQRLRHARLSLSILNCKSKVDHGNTHIDWRAGARHRIICELPSESPPGRYPERQDHRRRYLSGWRV